MKTENQIEALKAFALTHYDEGGHWVYETHSDSDYADILQHCYGNLTMAKVFLKNYWSEREAQADEIRAEMF